MKVYALDQQVIKDLIPHLEGSDSREAKQHQLDDFVDRLGIKGDDLNDLMYDLKQAGYHNLSKPSKTFSNPNREIDIDEALDTPFEDHENARTKDVWYFRSNGRNVDELLDNGELVHIADKGEEVSWEAFDDITDSYTGGNGTKEKVIDAINKLIHEKLTKTKASIDRVALADLRSVIRLVIESLHKDVSRQLAQKLGDQADQTARQNFLDDYVQEKGLKGDDLNDLMYDLDRAGFHHLKKPAPDRPQPPRRSKKYAAFTFVRDNGRKIELQIESVGKGRDRYDPTTAYVEQAWFVDNGDEITDPDALESLTEKFETEVMETWEDHMRGGYDD